ncbi:YybS family protein [Thermotalea metallivorans]|uniref:DUF2232 domain-containing protein n=1 Tax=Thermotalea metallivorans TaxID=520762 RepID=A0A140L023_9FIRM|nr:YybS family protein [Thermotalea metallivorans]KXG73898.1 hypothetical protein AN619_28180 [Thermotalea metallivorans]
MRIQNKTRALVEAALIVAITSIFVIIGNYIPFLSMLLIFLPVPFMILGKRHGAYMEILSIVTAGMVIGSLIGPMPMLFLFIQFGIMAIVMGYMMGKEYAVGKVWAGGTVASLISILLIISLISAVHGVNLVEQMMETMKKSIDMTMSFYRGMGVDADKLNEMEKMYDYMLYTARMILPSAVILAAVFSSYINYILTAFILNRIGHKTATFQPFRYFRLPKSIIMGTVIILVLTYVTGYLKIVNYETLMVNVSYLFNMVFFIQGLAVISFLTSAYGLGKPLRIFIYILAVLNPLGRTVAILLGLADAFADFRKLRKSHE